MITAYTLAGCRTCKELLSRLNSTSLPYRNIDVEANEELADNLENLLNTSIYPIVQIAKPTLDIYFTSEKSDHYYFDNTKIIFVYSGVAHLIDLIKRNL
jgi:glutaredoxin